MGGRRSKPRGARPLKVNKQTFWNSTSNLFQKEDHLRRPGSPCQASKEVLRQQPKVWHNLYIESPINLNSTQASKSSIIKENHNILNNLKYFFLQDKFGFGCGEGAHRFFGSTANSPLSNGWYCLFQPPTFHRLSSPIFLCSLFVTILTTPTK